MNKDEAKKRFAEIEKELKEMKRLEGSESNNKAQIITLRNKVLSGLFEMKDYFWRMVYRSDEDQFIEAFYKFMESIIINYDGKSPLENYAHFVWKKRKIDIYKKISKENADHNSLDEEKRDGDSGQLKYEKEMAETDTPETHTMVEDMGKRVLLEIVMAMGAMFEHGYTKQNNPIREKYYRLLYTGRMTDIVKEINLTSEKVQHERQIIEACNLNFLDFYMREKCRTITKIYLSDLKKGYEVGDMTTNEKTIPLPLEEKIYIKYCESLEDMKISKSLLSQNKKNFDNMLRTLEILNA